MFQHVLTVALNYIEIVSHAERDPNIKPSISKYN